MATPCTHYAFHTGHTAVVLRMHTAADGCDSCCLWWSMSLRRGEVIWAIGGCCQLCCTYFMACAGACCNIVDELAWSGMCVSSCTGLLPYSMGSLDPW